MILDIVRKLWSSVYDLLAYEKGDRSKTIEQIEEDLDALIEGLDDEASAASAMDHFGKAIEEKCKQVLEQDSTMQAVDVKAMQLMSKQLHVATRLAAHEEYYVPVEIDGGYTNIHLTFRHSSTSSVMIQMQRTEGQVFGARFELVKEKKLEGYFFAANAAGRMILILYAVFNYPFGDSRIPIFAVRRFNDLVNQILCI